MYTCPVAWAKATSAAHGFEHALGIANKNKAQNFAGPNGLLFRNESSVFWRNAFSWLKNRATASALQNVKNIQAQEAANVQN